MRALLSLIVLTTLLSAETIAELDFPRTETGYACYNQDGSERDCGATDDFDDMVLTIKSDNMKDIRITYDLRREDLTDGHRKVMEDLIEYAEGYMFKFPGRHLVNIEAIKDLLNARNLKDYYAKHGQIHTAPGEEFDFIGDIAVAVAGTDHDAQEHVLAENINVADLADPIDMYDIERADQAKRDAYLKGKTNIYIPYEEVPGKSSSYDDIDSIR